MLSKEALNLLFDAGAERVTGASLPGVAALLPQGYTIVSTEKLRPTPDRFRRIFTSTRLNDFLRYVKQAADTNSVVYLAPDMKMVTAVLNHGNASTPMWGDNTAVLELEHTPETAALLNACRREHSQLEFINFLEDWTQRDILVAIDSMGMEIHHARAIAAARRVTIEAKASSTTEQGQMRAARSSMEEIEATGDGDSLPAGLRLRAMVFPDTGERSLYARVSVLTSTDKPRFALRMVEWDWHLRELAAEIESRVRAELPEVPVYVGTSTFNLKG